MFQQLFSFILGFLAPLFVHGDKFNRAGRDAIVFYICSHSLLVSLSRTLLGTNKLGIVQYQTGNFKLAN